MASLAASEKHRSIKDSITECLSVRVCINFLLCHRIYEDRRRDPQLGINTLGGIFSLKLCLPATHTNTLTEVMLTIRLRHTLTPFISPCTVLWVLINNK